MKRRRQSGFTLIELALVTGVSVLIASTLLSMFQAHVSMLNQAAQYNFLAEDAPFIGLLLTKTIGNAEDYRIYSSGAAARGAGAPALTGLAVRLWMRQPNSTFRQAVVSYETVGGRSGIYFFLADNTGAFSATPNWEIAAGQLSSATFDASLGVLTITLNGSNNDWYKFAAEKK